MRAVVQDEYGPPEVLRTDEVDRPAARPGEVLLSMEAAGLGPEVWHLVAGMPLLTRLALGPKRPRRPVAGRDLAGRVAELGPGVTDFAIGTGRWGSVETGPHRRWPSFPVRAGRTRRCRAANGLSALH